MNILKVIDKAFLKEWVTTFFAPIIAVGIIAVWAFGIYFTFLYFLNTTLLSGILTIVITWIVGAFYIAYMTKKGKYEV